MTGQPPRGPADAANPQERVAYLEAALAQAHNRREALTARGHALAADLEKARAKLGDVAWRQPGRRRGQVADYATLLETEVSTRMDRILQRAETLFAQTEAFVQRERQQAVHSRDTLLGIAAKETDTLRQQTAAQAHHTRQSGATMATKMAADAVGKAEELRGNANKAALGRRQVVVSESSALSESARREVDTMRAVAEREAREILGAAKREVDEKLHSVGVELERRLGEVQHEVETARRQAQEQADEVLNQARQVANDLKVGADTEAVNQLGAARAGCESVLAQADSYGLTQRGLAADDAGRVRGAAQTDSRTLRAEAETFSRALREQADSEASAQRTATLVHASQVRDAAEQDAANLSAKVRQEASQLRAEATGIATVTRRQADEHVAQVLAEARAQAEQVLAAAREASSSLLEGARQQADTLVLHARQEMERAEKAIAVRTEANLAHLSQDRDRSLFETERMVTGPAEQRSQATQQLLEAQGRSSQIVAHAENYAEMLSQAAREEADSVLAEANGTARSTMDEAIEQAAILRTRSQNELDRLEAQRKSLDSYLSRLRRLVSRDLTRSAAAANLPPPL